MIQTRVQRPPNILAWTARREPPFMLCMKLPFLGFPKTTVHCMASISFEKRRRSSKATSLEDGAFIVKNLFLTK